MLAIVDPELDNGPRTGRSATMRMCAVSREVRPVEELIRFVLSPQGEVVPDLKRKLPGRGMWITASKAWVAEAVRRNQFSRGFKRDVRAASGLAADTESLLVRSAVEALAMAAKAGQVVSGFAKVEEALNILQFSPKAMADDVRKVLASAVANAENNHNLDVDALVVSEASVGKSISMKRFATRARGRSSRIVKPFSRIRVVVREQEEA